jgi:hypothetical protein
LNKKKTGELRGNRGKGRGAHVRLWKDSEDVTGKEEEVAGPVK